MTDNKPIEPYASMLAKAQARQDLRHDLVRWLAYPPEPRRMVDIPDIDALSLLDLCVHYRVKYAGADPNLKATWDGARIPYGSPSFDELVAKGWIHFDGCRWAFPPRPAGRSSDVVYPNDHTREFLHGLGVTSLQPANRGQSAVADALARDFVDGKRDLEGIAWRADADWIAAKLWETLCPAADVEDSVVDEAFSDWCAWCLVLKVAGKWSLDWAEMQMKHCREAAWRVLDRQTHWGTWGQDWERYAKVLSETFGIPGVYVRQSPAEDDGTLVERLQSLRDRAVQHLNEARFRPTAAGFALSVLRSELERTDFSPEVLASATRLVAVVVSHPMAFVDTAFRLIHRPQVLADLLMQPATASAAVMLIVEWRPHTSSWNREQSSQREELVKRFAVQDALAVLAHHLTTDQRELQELAALVTWCYFAALGIGPAVNAAVQRSVGRRLLATVGAYPPEVQIAFFEHLVSKARMQRNVRFAVFGGVLEALDYLPAAPMEATAPLIPLYTSFVQSKELGRTDVAELSNATVARLLVLALRQPTAEKAAFLFPIDLAARLKGAQDRAAVLADVSDVLRSHVRMLAKAVAGWKADPIPDELTEALHQWVWHTCIDHAEKARVGALTTRSSPMRFFARETGSPAEDIAAAWRRLDAKRQATLLRVLEDADDPVLLADLCRHLPSTAGIRLRERLTSLTPANAARPLTWLELEQRAAALIEAGEYGLAEVFLKEATTDDEHAPEAVRLKTFGLGLQLLIKKKAWSDIDVATVPANFSDLLKERAAEFLMFYRATSQMLRPGGNLKLAKQALASLAKKANSAVTYRENFYAAAIKELIGPVMRLLPEADKEGGARLLAEIDADIASIGPDPSRTQVLAEHRALMLIVLARPKEAIDTLAPFRSGRGTKQTELLAAMACGALGFEQQAEVILDAALREFGDDPELIAARKGLREQTSAAVTPTPSLKVDDVTAAKLAMFSLMRLQPEEMGQVLGPPDQGLRGYLTDVVSRALTSLQHVAPVLRSRDDPNDDRKLEDDLNTAVREILDTGLKIIGWTAKDQSLGGYTAAANPGERDAVICAGNREISVYEALVCGGVDRSNTISHFHKLLDYGTVDIYFLVIYSFAPDIDPLLESVEEIAQNNAPSHISFDAIKRLGPPNHETQGFAASYKIAKRDFEVVFLVADLGQRALRLAHRTAKATPAPKPKATAKKTTSSRAKKAP